MTCNEVRDLSDEWIHGELDSHAKREVKEHLCACEGCSAYFRSEEALSRLLGSSSSEPSDSVSSFVLSVISKEKRKESRERMRAFTKYASAAAMLVLVIGIASAFVSGGLARFSGNSLSDDPGSSFADETFHTDETLTEQTGSVAFFFSGYSESVFLLPEDFRELERLGILGMDFGDVIVYRVPEDKTQDFFSRSGISEKNLSPDDSIPEKYREILKSVSQDEGDFIIFVKK